MRLSTTLVLLLPALLLPTAPLAGAEPKRIVLARAEFPAVAPLALPALAFPGGLGIPRVITWADTTGASGIAWGSTSQITAANASITYNATNGVWNVPTGKGFSLNVNNVAQVTVSNVGAVVTVGPMTSTSFTANSGGLNTTTLSVGSTGNRINNIAQGGNKIELLGTTANKGFLAQSATADGAGAIAFQFGALNDLTTGKIISIGDNVVGTYSEKSYIDYLGSFQVNMANTAAGAGFFAQDATNGPALVYSGDSNTGAELIGKHPDGAAAIAIKLNTSVTYANATSKLLSVQNNSTERLSVDLSGAILLTNNASTAPAASEAYLQYDGSNGAWNVPTGKAFRFSVNNSSVFTASTTTIGFNGLQVDSAVSANLTTSTGQIDAAHIAGASGTPTSATAGTGCGTSSAPTISGSDLSGKIGVTCGTAGTNGNNFISATFKAAYNSTPICVISCANAATCAGEVLSDHMANPSTTAIAVSCAGGTCTTGTLLWNYVCHQ